MASQRLKTVTRTAYGRHFYLFLRYNDDATRHSIASDGEFAQVEAGPYFDFCKTVLASLNEFFASLPLAYEVKPISAAQVMRERRIPPDRA